MACRPIQRPEKGKAYVRRLVYDVIMYTLPMCGYPESNLPTTDRPENVYIRPNFEEIASLSALRVALVMRDKWRQMFLSRRKSSGFTEENTPRFLKQVVLCSPLSWVDTFQSVVEASLAICNEVAMFFYHEDIDFDLNLVLDSISAYICEIFVLHPNIPGIIEALVGNFDSVDQCKTWVTEFIALCALPYADRDDVSENFFLFIRAKWMTFAKDIGFTERPSLTQLRDFLGFLPEEMFLIIGGDESIDYLGDSEESSSESDLPGAHQSVESQMLPPISESDAAGVEESDERLLTESSNVPVEAAHGGECSKDSSELGVEDRLEQMSLVVEAVSRASQGAIPKKRKSPKKK